MRVVKITGSGAYNSSVVKGIVIKRDTEGTIKSVTDAKVAVFAQGVDTSSTETKVSSAKGHNCCNTVLGLLVSYPLAHAGILVSTCCPNRLSATLLQGGDKLCCIAFFARLLLLRFTSSAGAVSYAERNLNDEDITQRLTCA